MSFGNLTGNHDEGELDCPGCEEQFGFCSCGGVIHCEIQETHRRVPAKNAVRFVVTPLMVLECDRCDEYEVQ